MTLKCMPRGEAKGSERRATQAAMPVNIRIPAVAKILGQPPPIVDTFIDEF